MNFQSHVSIARYGFVQPYVDLKPERDVIEVDQLSWPEVIKLQVRVFGELISQVKSIFHYVFCWSCLIMPDPFRDDEASPDPQVIVCFVNHVDTSLFVKPIGQRAHPNSGSFEEIS